MSKYLFLALMLSGLHCSATACGSIEAPEPADDGPDAALALPDAAPPVPTAALVTLHAIEPTVGALVGIRGRVRAMAGTAATIWSSSQILSPSLLTSIGEQRLIVLTPGNTAVSVAVELELNGSTPAPGVAALDLRDGAKSTRVAVIDPAYGYLVETEISAVPLFLDVGDLAPLPAPGDGSGDAPPAIRATLRSLTVEAAPDEVGSAGQLEIYGVVRAHVGGSTGYLLNTGRDDALEIGEGDTMAVNAAAVLPYVLGAGASIVLFLRERDSLGSDEVFPTASAIWSLADGTMQDGEIVTEVAGARVRAHVRIEPAPAFVLPCDAGDQGNLEKSDGGCLMLYGQSRTWQDAALFCESIGAHLATITSQAEQDEARAVVGQWDAWIGSRKPAAGAWSWQTGEAFEFSQWDGGQPDIVGEGCLRIDGDVGGRWHDSFCTEKWATLCERDAGAL